MDVRASLSVCIAALAALPTLLSVTTLLDCLLDGTCLRFDMERRSCLAGQDLGNKYGSWLRPNITHTWAASGVSITEMFDLSRGYGDSRWKRLFLSLVFLLAREGIFARDSIV